MEPLIQSLFALSPKVRYVALLRGKELQLHERPGLSHASASETDRYEELLVNPAVLTLLRRRGELDCGGLDHVWIRYGNFWTGLFPTVDGHVNVGLEPDAVPTEHVPAIRAVLARGERG
jgi:predicted membrane-bound spermidine synthase